MRPGLTRLLPYTPSVVKKAALMQLFRATAAAFQRDMPQVAGLSQEERLLAYAHFSAAAAGEALRDGGDLAELQERLYRNAYRLGRTPGRLLGVESVGDAMALGRLLYSILEIEFEGSEDGEIAINRCYFSRFYTPDVCRVMSAMDAGLLAGLMGGGELAFSQRITEGRPCCRAHFTPAAGPSAATPGQEQTL